MLYEKDLTEKIIGAAIEVHKLLGPGLLESVYEACLCYELSLSKLNFKKQVLLPLQYKEIKLDCGYKLDIVVENKIIIELKSVETLLPIHKAQLITYLKLSKIKIGFLINFNTKVLKEGIIRMVL